MKMRKVLAVVTALFVALTFAGCGGGGGTADNQVSDDGGVTSGVAVDPYISGAVFAEIDGSGNTTQESSPSTDQGVFTFKNALQEGSIVVMQTPGLHNGTPFKGLLKRRVNISEGSLVVSPLTTLVADGTNTAADVVALLDAAGISGVIEEDINADPMQKLAGKTKTDVTADDMKLLTAAMAVNAALNTVKNDVESTGLQGAVKTVADTLNQVLDAANNNPDADLDDVVTASVVIANYLVEKVEESVTSGGATDSTVVLQDEAANIDQAVVDATVEATTTEGTSLALDDSTGEIKPVSVSGTIAEYLEAGFADMQTAAGDVAGTPTDAFLSAVENFQAAGALVGIDTTASANEKDQARFFSSLARLGALADPYSDLADNGLNNFGDILDGFDLGGSNADRSDFDLIRVEECVEVPESGYTYTDCDLPDLPADSPTSGDLMQVLQQKVGAGLESAIGNLAQVSAGFSKNWTDPIDDSVTEFDYADALFLKGVAQAMLAELNMLKAYDFDVDLDAEQQRELDAEAASLDPTVEEFQTANSSLGTLVDPSSLATAKTYIGSAVESLRSSIDAMDAEEDAGDDQNDDLINLYSCGWDANYTTYSCAYDEQEVLDAKDALDKVEAGLSAPVMVDDQGNTDSSDDVYIDFSKFFDGIDLNSKMPTYTGNIAGDFPDRTMGAILDPETINLNEDLDADGNPDLLNGYTNFFDEFVTGKGLGSYHEWGTGWASEHVRFAADNAFQYDLSLSDSSETSAGTWVIDAVTKELILTFDTPVTSWRPGNQIDEIRMEMTEGGEDGWAYGTESRYLKGVQDGDPSVVDWDFYEMMY